LDGRRIFYQTNGGEANAEIWLASVADHKVMPLLQTRFDTDTGRSEIYVQRFQGGDSPKLAGPGTRSMVTVTLRTSSLNAIGYGQIIS
jgi:hypothetical protein